MTQTGDDFSIRALQQAFEQLRGGGARAWSDYIAKERPRMFDFSIRMTGQLNRSEEVVAEVASSMAPILTQYIALSDLRIELYRTLRNFNADIWNADVRLLANQVEGHVLEKWLQELLPQDREILLLRRVCLFSDEDAAKVLGVSENLVRDVDRRFEGGNTPSFSSFQLFSIPVRSVHKTADLSVLIQDLKESRLGWASRHRFVLSLLVSALLLAAYLVMRYR